jgi:surface carbohydrate biosynthesis protein
MATVTPSTATRRPPRQCPPAPRTNHPRIALVVDHPLRDLSGMVLLATDLARRGAVCYLIPLNLCELEVGRQTLDFVLLNYYRKNFDHFYRALAAAGIGMGVLDTEGGVLESTQSLGENLVADAPLRAAVDCYCCWGPNVASYLVDHDWFTAQQVRITGCPRTDLFAAPFSAAAAVHADAVAPYAKNLILLNANFSIGNPAFLSDEQQFQLLVEQLEHSPQRVRQWQAKEKAGLRQLASLAVDLARRFPQATVVYRPHPFERLATYDSLLAPLDNLHCVRAGSIDAWLLKARVVIQRSCSTSIEAGMAGTVALMPEWISTPFERPAANRTSVAQRTPEALFHSVDQILSGEFEVPGQVTADLDEVIRDWFFRVDGQAHRRVADAILESVDTTPAARGRRRAVLRRNAYGLNRKLTSSKRWRGAVRAACGLPPSWSLLRWHDTAAEPEELTRWRQSAKHFDLDQVRRTASALLDCQDLPADTIAVETARQPADYQFGYAQGCAIKIAPPDAETNG